MTNSKLLIIEDDKDLREALEDTLVTEGYEVLAISNAYQALDNLKKDSFDLVISDVEMPGMKGTELLTAIKNEYIDIPVILITAYGTIEQAVKSVRGGASEYLVKPFEAETLLQIVKKHLRAKVELSENTIHDENTRKLYNLAGKVARSDVSVLINGESGVGKEVLARFIHQNSFRSHKPFIAINCAAIPENMLESVLFGYEKGAFTGAHQRNPGKFELAQEGTLLLDEISEMDLSLQAKLLRVLQEKEVERLGGHTPIKLNVRVLATTNRNLREEVKEGNFREDLFYRLNVFPLTIPSLRQRCKDIIPIAESMIERFFLRSQKSIYEKPTLDELAQKKLLDYSWPGNIRELENVIQRALVVKHGNRIRIDDLVIEGGLNNSDNVYKPNRAAVLPADLKQHEQDLILQALARGNGSRKFAAETLGISPRTLRYKLSKMRESGIKIPSAYSVA